MSLPNDDSFWKTMNNIIIGIEMGTKNYSMLIDSRESTAVNIVDNTRGSTWDGSIVRADRPHGNVNFNHLNINPDISGVPDPHTPISPTALNVLRSVAIASKAAYNTAIPLARTFQDHELEEKAKEDFNHGTTRSTATAAANTAGAYAGGYSGAEFGLKLGEKVYPGIGGLVGSIVCGVIGSLSGAQHAEEAVSYVGDKYEWDIETIRCSDCRTLYKCRKYTDQSRRLCKNCEQNRRP